MLVIYWFHWFNCFPVLVFQHHQLLSYESQMTGLRLTAASHDAPVKPDLILQPLHVAPARVQLVADNP